MYGYSSYESSMHNMLIISTMHTMHSYYSTVVL